MNRKFLRYIPFVKRLYPSIVKKLFFIFNIGDISFKFFDVNFFLNINEPMEKDILLFDYYENEQINFLIQRLKNENFDYFFDIGANSGLYSLIIGNLFSSIKIKSFEPIKNSIKKFKNNLSINKNINNIEIYHFGLSNKNSELLMKAYKKKNFIQSGGFGVAKKNENLKNLHTELAFFKKTDDLIDVKNKKLMIKIDTEGHEFEVLEGMNKIILNNKILFQIEIFDKNFTKIENMLKKKKFQIINSISNGHKTDYFFSNNVS